MLDGSSNVLSCIKNEIEEFFLFLRMPVCACAKNLEKWKKTIKSNLQILERENIRELFKNTLRGWFYKDATSFSGFFFAVKHCFLLSIRMLVSLPA